MSDTKPVDQPRPAVGPDNPFPGGDEDATSER